MGSRANSTSRKDEITIYYHTVTNKIDDSFVGLKMRNNRIDFYYPETFDFDNSSLENARKDILAILNTISIAKTHSNANVKIESSFSKNKALPILSFLWIIQDYLKNGFYTNREKILKKNQRGRVDWKRTLNGQPIISKGNVIYSDLVVEAKNELDNILVEIHKYCVKKSLDILGWLFRINNTSFISIIPINEGLRNLYVDTLKRELDKTFDDVKKRRLTHMLTIVEGLSDDQNADELVYGVDSYEYVFERMINSIFGNRDATNFNPSADWYLKTNNYESFKSSDLRPDTVLVHNNIAYVLDAKYYRYGFTGDKRHLPETTSIQKQITYGDYIKQNKLSDEIKGVRNAFVLPYNKNNNKLKLNNILEYIGYSKANYRKGQQEYEIIHAFLIDLKYVINTWNKSNHKEDIDTLIKDIEEIQRTRIKEEKDNAYADSIVKIKEGEQTFEGGIYNSFFSTINNKKLKESLDNHHILFVDDVFVINDKKYVETEGNKRHLTLYAVNHMDECCLAFDNSDDNSSDNLPFPFCDNCETRKKNKTKNIKISDEHNQRIYLRAQDADIDRIVEDLDDALNLQSQLNGTFGSNLRVLMDDSGFNTPYSVYKRSYIDNHKISKFLDDEVKPSLRECVALCAAFELHPLVSYKLLESAGFNLKGSNSLQYQFYEFLIDYCYGEELKDWTLKIAKTNHAEWQIP